MSTKPTIETVLERINVLGQQIHNEIESVRESLAAQLGEFSAALRKIDRKIEILNNNVLSVQADNRDIVIRVEHIESKVL